MEWWCSREDCFGQEATPPLAHWGPRLLPLAGIVFWRPRQGAFAFSTAASKALPLVMQQLAVEAEQAAGLVVERVGWPCLRPAVAEDPLRAVLLTTRTTHVLLEEATRLLDSWQALERSWLEPAAIVHGVHRAAEDFARADAKYC